MLIIKIKIVILKKKLLLSLKFLKIVLRIITWLLSKGNNNNEDIYFLLSIRNWIFNKFFFIRIVLFLWNSYKWYI